MEEQSFPLESAPMAKENLQIVESAGSRGQKILHLKGSLTIHTVFSFQDAIRANTAPVLIIDFSGVPYIDSAGLGALVGVYVGSQKAMRKLAFAAMNTQVKALVDMTNVAQLFKAYATVQDAEAGIS
jgi:anti-sigma B factor antagonist